LANPQDRLRHPALRRPLPSRERRRCYFAALDGDWTLPVDPGLARSRRRVSSECSDAGGAADPDPIPASMPRFFVAGDVLAMGALL